MTTEKLIIENSVVMGCRGENAHLVIPEGVVEIGEAAFKDCLWLKSIEIKSSVFRTVGDKAFKGCSNLRKVTVESMRGAIGAYSFDNCTQLESLTIPTGAMEIRKWAFNACTKLNNVTIPSSVMVIDDTAFDTLHSKRLLILCSLNTEAARYAEKNHIPYRQYSRTVEDALESAREARNALETRVFNLFGQQIAAPNSLSLHVDILKFYAQRKNTFFNAFLKHLPSTASATVDGNRAIKDLDAVIQKTIERLEKNGVFTNRSQINIEILEAYEKIITVITAAHEFRNELWNVGSSNLANVKDQLLLEAESKVTGLSYGVIGDGLTMAAYAIDDFRERQRQRESAYSEAKQQFNVYASQADAEINAAYNRFYNNTAKSALRTGTDALIDALCSAELRLLKEYGLMEEFAEGTYDAKKSAEIINRAHSMDKEYAVGLALKVYPLNTEALAFAGRNNLATEELLEYIEYMQLAGEPEMDSVLKSNKISISTLIQFYKSSATPKHYKSELVIRSNALNDLINTMVSGNGEVKTAEDYQEQIGKHISQNLWVAINRITPVLSNQLLKKLEVIQTVIASAEGYNTLGYRIFEYNNRTIFAEQWAKSIANSERPLKEKISELHKVHSLLSVQTINDLLRADFIACMEEILKSGIPEYTGFNTEEITQYINNAINACFDNKTILKIKEMRLSITYATESWHTCSWEHLTSKLSAYYIDAEKKNNGRKMREQLKGILDIQDAFAVAKDFLWRVNRHELWVMMNYHCTKASGMLAKRVCDLQIPKKTTQSHVEEQAERAMLAVLDEDGWIAYYVATDRTIQNEEKAKEKIAKKKKAIEEEIKNRIYDNYVKAHYKVDGKHILEKELDDVKSKITKCDGDVKVLVFGILMILASVICGYDLPDMEGLLFFLLFLLCGLLFILGGFLLILVIKQWIVNMWYRMKANKLEGKLRKMKNTIKYK